jgi:hypothetical protein
MKESNTENRTKDLEKLKDKGGALVKSGAPLLSLRRSQLALSIHRLLRFFCSLRRPAPIHLGVQLPTLRTVIKSGVKEEVNSCSEHRSAKPKARES